MKDILKTYSIDNNILFIIGINLYYNKYVQKNSQTKLSRCNERKENLSEYISLSNSTVQQKNIFRLTEIELYYQN